MTSRRNARVIAEFRANRGEVGGDFARAPLLLLHTVGARTGQPRVTPAMYLPDDGRYLIFATNGIPVIALTPTSRDDKADATQETTR